MLRKLRPRSIYDVCAALALFVALGGTAYAIDTVRSSDIVNGEVKSVDIGNNEIGSGDVKDNSINTFDVHSFLGVDVVDETLTGADIDNGTLEDQDVAQNAYVDFPANIGPVLKHSCWHSWVTGIDVTGDHMVLTPSRDDSSYSLTYTVEYNEDQNHASIKTCNPTGGDIDDGITHFNLLVFDAQ